MVVLCGRWKLKLEHRPTVLSLSCIQTEPQIPPGHRTFVSYLSQQIHEKALLHRITFTIHHAFIIPFTIPFPSYTYCTTAPLTLSLKEVLSSMGISCSHWLNVRKSSNISQQSQLYHFPFPYLLLTSQVHGCKGIAQRLTCLASAKDTGSPCFF